MKSSCPVALVTGSTSGIGAAIARRLSNEGYAIIVHSRSSADTGRALARELTRAAYVQADLTNEADRARLVREAIAVWGRLDVLVNNAVAPGLVDTPMTADWTQAQKIWKEQAPMRRAASPEDIGQAVAMLVASDYLTGEVLLSDGGLNLT